MADRRAEAMVGSRDDLTAASKVAKLVDMKVASMAA